jgi:urea transport system ATP-binding protein
MFHPRRDETRQQIDVTRQPKHKLVRLGLGRKFQTPSVYRSLTCWENLEVSLGFRTGLVAQLRGLRAVQRDRIAATLEQVGLLGRVRALAGELSHGEQQWLEIAMLLVQEPTVLLLDEPVAGMTGRERERTGALLHDLERHHSIVITEHDMEFVRQFSRTVTVLHQGKVLAEGTVDEIQRNRDVVEVYLGRSRAVLQRAS